MERVPGEAGWMIRGLTALVVVGVLATARPERSWAWGVLGVGFLAWLAGSHLMTRDQRGSLVLLVFAGISACLIVGMPGANALVIALVALIDIAVKPYPQGNKPVIAAGLGCAVAVAVSGWWWGRENTWYLSQLIWLILLPMFGMSRRQFEIQARQTAELLHQTQLAQQEHARAAALDERGRIARELHDVLAHSLGALSVQLELAEALLDERQDTAGALDRIRRSRRLAVQGLVEARNAVAALRADVPALPEALRVLADQHRADHGTQVTLVQRGTPRPVASGVAVALLGVAREALTNAAKHAPGRPVDVRLDYRDGVRLAVRNPGTTVRPAIADQGFGLAGMRERLALVGGRLEAGPDGDAWLVVAEVADE